ISSSRRRYRRKNRLAKGRGCLNRAFLAVAFVCLVCALVAAALANYWYLGPYRGFETQTFVDIDRGMSSRQIARTLAHQGVVRSQWAFLFVRAVHYRAPLQAGEYRFATAQTPWQVFDEIHRGEIFY